DRRRPRLRERCSDVTGCVGVVHGQHLTDDVDATHPASVDGLGEPLGGVRGVRPERLESGDEDHASSSLPYPSVSATLHERREARKRDHDGSGDRRQHEPRQGVGARDVEQHAEDRRGHWRAAPPGGGRRPRRADGRPRPRPRTEKDAPPRRPPPGAAGGAGGPGSGGGGAAPPAPPAPPPPPIAALATTPGRRRPPKDRSDVTPQATRLSVPPTWARARNCAAVTAETANVSLA